MNQMTFSDMEYSGRKRVTQKEKFLREMNDIIPWADWVNKILPYYPKGKRGRPPRGIEVMLRMYLLQIWFNLSDEGLEDAIYDSYAMRNFVGINFLEEQVPDATSLLKFRHLLEEHHLGEEIFNDIKERLEQAGLMMRGGTIVDATIIHSTPSTKNKEGKRDPEMHQTKKGNQWYHGMKVHSGVDCAPTHATNVARQETDLGFGRRAWCTRYNPLSNSYLLQRHRGRRLRAMSFLQASPRRFTKILG